MQALRKNKRDLLHAGTVIPAHPLALNEKRRLDEAHQRRLTRYYIAAEAGGIAVGVHSTQFEIRDPKVNLYETVLMLAAEEVEKAQLLYPFIKVAGICGPTEQAVKEAELAIKYNYDLGLLSMGGLQNWTEQQILDRVRAVAAVIPVFGFYLQPSVGGRIFSYDFWLEFAEIANIEAIKVAAFNRYQTLDVVRAVCHSSRSNEIALYTGNDDNIIADLLTTYRFTINGKTVEKEFVGGLLGHWAVWTHAAVQLLKEIKNCKASGRGDMADLLTKGIQVTDMNAAIFDSAHSFHGCIPGIHEVLRRQGLLDGRWCLNPQEELSAGQMEEIDRVCSAYPHLTDDAFVAEWLRSENPVKV
ncbi:dihydrodipicolinate synthase family protein [Pedobacter sp. BS3]|uniref:dihydrodipicolinate synthase family protein n=1 Tax=Pedobacter sp. BS3 TaxID=2567937 RepID=UPI0011EC90D3|nr:dihydrodipicolinate synthase family protein [Pedobacter sp. BS3]TZF81449.1 dihydrodipicolinate synthase family protein [Pedobacter sp. BS3]